MLYLPIQIICFWKDYQDSINNVQTKLLNLIDDTNKIKKAITTEIKEESIATHSVSSSKKTVNKINKALGKSRSTLDTLGNDATKYIKKIVDEYNNSLDPEGDDTRLSYVEIKLSSVSGCPAEGDYDNDYSGNWGGGSNYPDEITIDYYIELLKYSDVYSNNIENWDLYVKKFLEDNNLTNVIDKIEIDGKKIKVKLKNGKEYEFEEITTTIDLLKALYKKIEEEASNT